MLPVLRPYQHRVFEELRSEVHAGHNPVLVMPCGSGKGSLISVIIHRAVNLNRNIIFTVHGKSLVADMSERVRKLGIEHGVLMGGERRERWHPVQVASIDTLHRMPHPPAADIIIVDEAHMALSPTWRRTLARYPDARVIGMTATPIRLDGKGLGKQTGGLFDSMVMGPSEEELISLGHLVGSRVLAPPPPAGMANVRRVRGELDVKQQATICDTAKVLGDCVAHWQKYASNRKTAAFGCDQHHANAIAERFRMAGVNWAYVDADTSLEDRARIWRDLDSDTSDLMGISSCGCTVVGWDHSIVSCLVVERKTVSLGLWRQMLGRGSRPHPGKEDFLVLDHVGNTHEHEPYGMFEDQIPWSLEGEAIKETKKDDAPTVKQCKRCYATFRAGPKECPFCGLPQVVKPRAVEVQAGELQELARKAYAKAHEHPGHRADYEGLMEQAFEKNYKPAWVGLQFKAKHRYWPPKAWEIEWESRRLNELMAASETASVAEKEKVSA